MSKTAMDPERRPSRGGEWAAPEAALSSQSSQSAALILLLGFAGLGLLLVLSAFSLLKENALFWRNAGGYPVALRELVLVFYYPLLGASFLLCGAVGALLIREHRSGGRCSLLSIAIAALLWTLLCLNAGFTVANNLENLLEGRAAHYHPPI